MIKIGVAGVGNMGANHVRVLSELSDEFELVGIYDVLTEKRKIASRYGIKFFDSYEDMLEEVEAVSIVCPTSMHKELALKAANKGVHALIEKPIAETAEDAIDILAAFETRGLKMTVGQVERFNPVVRAISDLTRKLDVIAVELHRCNPYDPRIFDVDVIADLMIHDIDIAANAIGGGKVKSLAASGRKVYSEDFIDYAQAVMTKEDGTVVSITASRCTEEKIRKLVVHAKEQYIVGDLVNKTLFVRKSISYDEKDANEYVDFKQSNALEQIVLRKIEPLKEEIASFGRAVNGTEEMMVTGQQILKDMNIMASIRGQVYGGETFESPVL